jgi:hypothetical protein
VKLDRIGKFESCRFKYGILRGSTGIFIVVLEGLIRNFVGSIDFMARELGLGESVNCFDFYFVQAGSLDCWSNKGGVFEKLGSSSVNEVFAKLG